MEETLYSKILLHLSFIRKQGIEEIKQSIEFFKKLKVSDEEIDSLLYAYDKFPAIYKYKFEYEWSEEIYETVRKEADEEFDLIINAIIQRIIKDDSITRKDFPDVRDFYTADEIYKAENPQSSLFKKKYNKKPYLFLTKFYKNKKNPVEVKIPNKKFSFDKEYGVIIDSRGGYDYLEKVFKNIFESELDVDFIQLNSDIWQDRVHSVLYSQKRGGELNHQIYNECEDFDDNSEQKTYNSYNGSWAQDVEGLSDDYINDVLDGDPDAYWNID